MDALRDLLLLLLAGCLFGALRTCWLGRDKRPAPARQWWAPFRLRVVWAPHGTDKVSKAPEQAPEPVKEAGRESQAAYFDQLLAEQVWTAQRRVRLLKQLDERLGKPASSLG